MCLIITRNQEMQPGSAPPVILSERSEPKNLGTAVAAQVKFVRRSFGALISAA